jgi:hypothetical protein
VKQLCPSKGDLMEQITMGQNLATRANGCQYFG